MLWKQIVANLGRLCCQAFAFDQKDPEAAYANIARRVTHKNQTNDTAYSSLPLNLPPINGADREQLHDEEIASLSTCSYSQSVAKVNTSRDRILVDCAYQPADIHILLSLASRLPFVCTIGLL
jgi:hypothetical protein